MKMQKPWAVGGARLAVAALCALAAGDAAAQPVVIEGETWTHERLERGDQLSRADGTVIELGASALPCGSQLRVVPTRRPDWLPTAYWPTLDAGAGFLSLCLERLEGTVVITVKPPAGQVAGADLAPILTHLALELRPPTELADLGTIHPSSPLVGRHGDTLTFLVDGKPTEVAVVVRPHGTCAFQHAQVLARIGEVTRDEVFGAGYWETVFEAGGHLHGCLELREGYVSVVVAPSPGPSELVDVLAELRRALHAVHGAPLTTDDDPLILPRTQQRVAAAGGTGAWKVVAGERFDLPGGDVLVSILPLGANSTLYAIGVHEGRCTPSTVAAPPEVAVALFPPRLGAVWVDDRLDRARWRAWACIGAEATLTVMGPDGGDQAPAGLEARMIQAMVTEVARSYGVDVSGDRPHRGVSAAGGTHVVAAAHAGVLSLAPPGGDRRQGALVGVSVRMADTGILGPALAFDMEVGFGDGGLIGEVRTGGGVAGGIGGAVLDVVAGAAVASFGPAAEIDLYAQTSLSVPLGPTRLWLGAMHAVGIDGPDQDRLEVRFAVPHHDDVGFYLGARQLWIDDAGSALVVTFGGGVVGTD